MTIDKAKLRALAERATAGPWQHGGTWVSTARGNSVADCQRGDEAFIAAANPATVLALLAEIERLEARAATEQDRVMAAIGQYAPIQAERDQLKAETERLTNIVGDFCVLTKRFVHRLRKAAPDNDLPDQALDYLKRKGLQGSPLRAKESGQ